MSVGTFPKVLYRKTNAGGYFSIKGGEEKYTFQVGDVLNVGIKKNFDDDENILSKKITVDEAKTEVLISFTSEETANVPSDTYAWLEVRLASADGRIKEPVYQEKIYLGGVVIDE